jgi:predicted HTH transcriptional regulator
VALREAVINAIVHNDYTTENPPVFEIFSDRIEITSTGGLSIIKNIDDFFSGYSNPTSRELMRIYKDLELVEHLGSGLNRILEAYDKDSFVMKQNYMKNIFYKNETPLDGVVSGGVNGVVSGGVNGVVSGGVTELLEFIQINPGLKANELSKHIDTPLRTVQRWLKQLKDENKIEFQGAPKTGGYVVIYDDIKNNS